MNARLPFLVGLLLAGTTAAWGQGATFTLDAATLRVDDQGETVVIEALTDVRYVEGTQRIQAGAARALLTREGEMRELALTGSVRYEDSATSRVGSAGRLTWTPASNAVQFADGVTYEQTTGLALFASAGRVTLTPTTGDLDAWEEVLLRLPAVSGLTSQGDAALPLTLEGANIRFMQATQALEAEGTPTVSATLRYGDLTLVAPLLQLTFAEDQLRSLTNEGDFTLSGDIRGSGEPAVLRARVLEYFPEPARFEIEGPIEMTQDADVLTATHATVHLGAPRRIEFAGLKIAARVDSPS